MTSLALIKALQIYGIATVIAFLVAALIKVMVWVTGRLEQPATVKAQPSNVTSATSVAPAPATAPEPATHPGIPEEDVAAIFAAIFAVIGPHHILHIGHASSTWTSQGRAEHHTSHSGLHRPRH